MSDNVQDGSEWSLGVTVLTTASNTAAPSVSCERVRPFVCQLLRVLDCCGPSLPVPHRACLSRVGLLAREGSVTRRAPARRVPRIASPQTLPGFRRPTSVAQDASERRRRTQSASDAALSLGLLVTAEFIAATEAGSNEDTAVDILQRGPRGR